jgi:hypothetical protein
MFVWEQNKRPSHPGKRDHVYRQELEDRAALLCRLGFSSKKAKARLRANLHWDFELHAKPKLDHEIDKIVDAVYKRRGSAAHLSL